MSAERRRILSMLAEGKISVDECEEMLSSLPPNDRKTVEAPAKKKSSNGLTVLLIVLLIGGGLLVAIVAALGLVFYVRVQPETINQLNDRIIQETVIKDRIIRQHGLPGTTEIILHPSGEPLRMEPPSAPTESVSPRKRSVAVPSNTVEVPETEGPSDDR